MSRRVVTTWRVVWLLPHPVRTAQIDTTGLLLLIMVATVYAAQGYVVILKSGHKIRCKEPLRIEGPNAIITLVTRASAGPNMLRYVDATLGCLRKAGFSYEVADHAWNAMDNHIYGYTLQELNFPFAEPEYADVAQEFLDLYPPDEVKLRPNAQGADRAALARRHLSYETADQEEAENRDEVELRSLPAREREPEEQQPEPQQFAPQ